jgi:hypothetical protein
LATPSSNVEPLLFLVVILVLLLVRRTYAQLQGARYSVGRLFAFAGIYVVIFGLFAYGTLYAAAAVWGPVAYGLIAAYVAVPGVAAVLSAPYVEKIVRFEFRAYGGWYYRLPWLVPVLYLILFVTRFGAELVIYGASGLATFPPPAPPTTAALEVLVGVDLLFGVSLGLLVGRGFGVYRAYQHLPLHPSEVPASPPLSSG